MALKKFLEFINEDVRGGSMQTYNSYETADTLEDARKLLKDINCEWDKEMVTWNGTVEFRRTSKVISPNGGTYSVAMYNPSSKKLHIDASVTETIGTVNAPIYDEFPENFPEIQLEKDEKHFKRMKEIATILKELFSAAIDNEYDGNRIKEAMFPKYKGTKTKIHVTEDGHIRFDSFGRYPDIKVNLNNMKKGKHTKETIKEEIKSNLKKLEERMPGMPSQSGISSFAD